MLAALAVGVVVGLVIRNVPAVVAALTIASRLGSSCGIEEVLRCAIITLPDAFGALIKFVLIAIAVGGVLAAAGLTTGIVGLTRLRHISADAPLKAYGSSGALLALGIALMTPALWFIGAFVVALIR